MATKVCKHKNITISNNIIRLKIEFTPGKKNKAQPTGGVEYVVE